MKTTELNTAELESVLGGDFAYDVGRLLRFVYFSGGGIYAGYALGDWAAMTAMNDAQAEK
jgi:hypothetical protein